MPTFVYIAGVSRGFISNNWFDFLKSSVVSAWLRLRFLRFSLVCLVVFRYNNFDFEYFDRKAPRRPTLRLCCFISSYSIKSLSLDFFKKFGSIFFQQENHIDRQSCYRFFLHELFQNRIKTMSVFGAGLLVGTALSVIIPEGLHMVIEHDSNSHYDDHHHHHHEIASQTHEQRNLAHLHASTAGDRPPPKTQGDSLFIANDILPGEISSNVILEFVSIIIVASRVVYWGFSAASSAQIFELHSGAKL